jgi:hypothetical protein
MLLWYVEKIDKQSKRFIEFSKKKKKWWEAPTSCCTHTYRTISKKKRRIQNSSTTGCNDGDAVSHKVNESLFRSHRFTMSIQIKMNRSNAQYVSYQYVCVRMIEQIRFTLQEISLLLYFRLSLINKILSLRPATPVCVYISVPIDYLQIFISRLLDNVCIPLWCS